MLKGRSVSIVQRRMTHYRVPLFDLLRAELERRDVSLQVLHGEPQADERTRDDAGELPWARRLPTRYLGQRGLCWQPFARWCRDSDLVVLTQENKLVNNLWPLIDPWRRQRLAFWGHGANLQADDPGSLAERFKRWTTCRVDWWFAYTELSAALVRGCGFAPDRISVLNNSIDTAGLRAAVEAARTLPAPELRRSLGLGAGPVAVFIGSLYADKRIDWLLHAADVLRVQVPGFQLAIAGAGPLEPLVRDAAARSGTVVYLGAVHGTRKAQLLASADVMLNPGSMGLGVLDAFAAGLPLVAVEALGHGPEIAYLQSGVNGLLVDNELDAFTAASAGVLRDAALRRQLAAQALASGQRYSVEQMAMNFADGLCAALSLPGPGRDCQQS